MKTEIQEAIRETFKNGADSFYTVLNLLSKKDRNLFYEQEKECSAFVRDYLNYQLDYTDGDYIVYKGSSLNDLINRTNENISVASFHLGDVYFNGNPEPADLFQKWQPVKGQLVIVWNDGALSVKIKRASEADIVTGAWDNILPYLGQDLAKLGF